MLDLARTLTLTLILTRCGLLDLLYAYCYDCRATDGEPTVESGWTARSLSSLLTLTLTLTLPYPEPEPEPDPYPDPYPYPYPSPSP